MPKSPSKTIRDGHQLFGIQTTLITFFLLAASVMKKVVLSSTVATSSLDYASMSGQRFFRGSNEMV